MSLLGGILKDVLPGSLLGASQPSATAAAAAPKQTSASVSTPPSAISSAPAPEATAVTSKPSVVSLPTSALSTSTASLSISSALAGSRDASAIGVQSMTKSDLRGGTHTFSSSAARGTSVATSGPAKTQSHAPSRSSMPTGFIIFLACAGLILLWIIVMGMVLRRRRHRASSERDREVQTQMSGMVGFGKLDDGPPSPPIPLTRPRQNTIDLIEGANRFDFDPPHGVDHNDGMYYSNSAYDEKHGDLGNFSRVEMMGMQEYPPPPKMYHENEMGMGMHSQYNNQIGVAIGNTPSGYVPDFGLENPPPPRMYHDDEMGMGIQPQYNHQIGVAVGDTPSGYVPDVGLENRPPPRMYHENEIGMGIQPQYNHQIGVAVDNTPSGYAPDVGLERAIGAQANRTYPVPDQIQDQSTTRADQRDSSFPESLSQEATWIQPEPPSWGAYELSFPQTPSATHSSHIDVSANQRFSTGLGYLYPIRDSVSEQSCSEASSAARTSVSESDASHRSESYGDILPNFSTLELGSGLVDRPTYTRSRSNSEDTIGPRLMPLPGVR